MPVFDINASNLRALIRATVVIVTAFGLKLEPEQIGAIQVFTEAVLALIVFNANRQTPSGDPAADGE